MIKTEKDNHENCPNYDTCDYLKRLGVKEQLTRNYRADFCTGNFDNCNEKKRLDDYFPTFLCGEL